MKEREPSHQNENEVVVVAELNTGSFGQWVASRLAYSHNVGGQYLHSQRYFRVQKRFFSAPERSRATRPAIFRSEQDARA